MASYGQLIEQAKSANKKHDMRELRELCERICAALPVPSSKAGACGAELMKELRNNRRYDQIQFLGESFIKAGYHTPRIWTVYAQALVDRGNQVAAMGVLTSLLAGPPDDEISREYSEIHGILGRAWKDIAYESIGLGRSDVAARALRKSHECYSRGLDTDPDSVGMLAWHGTQIVALGRLASSREIEAGLADQTELAQRILKRMQAAYVGNGRDDPWILTAAGEMCVALNDYVGAQSWYELAIKLKHIDSFTLASTHRQLSQIWGIGESSGAVLEALLLNALVRKGGGFHLTRGNASNLQALIGTTPPVSIKSLKRAMKAAESIAMIRTGYSPLGTGFLVTAESIGLDATFGNVIVTNAHVVSDPSQSGAALPEDVQVTFELEPGDKIYTVKSILKCLPVEEHDCTVIKLREDISPAILPLPVNDLPLVLPHDPTAVVIGHPLGQEISFSFLDGRLVGFEELPKTPAPQRMHYRSPTENGSSGSPVFNRNWQVVGIHHKYLEYATPLNNKPGVYAANEGISMGSIRRAFKAGLG